MRRHFLFLLALLCAVGCNPLKIVLNSRTSDGERTVLTSDQPLFRMDGHDISVALGARMHDRDSVMALLVTCESREHYGIFNVGNRMMIRLADQSVITLTNIYDKEYENKTEAYQTTDRIVQTGVGYAYNPWDDYFYLTPYEVSTFIPRTTVVRKNLSYALYLVSREDLQKIVHGKVIKFRIETEDSEYDMPNPKGVSELFASMYDLLSKCVAGGVAVRSEF